MFFTHPYETAILFIVIAWYFFLIVKVYNDQNK
jgi:large-conductance mechanosensitive channel